MGDLRGTACLIEAGFAISKPGPRILVLVNLGRRAGRFLGCSFRRGSDVFQGAARCSQGAVGPPWRWQHSHFLTQMNSQLLVYRASV
jgi:hypothetical protein